jgi:hypothetical protein
MDCNSTAHSYVLFSFVLQLLLFGLRVNTNPVKKRSALGASDHLR